MDATYELKVSFTLVQLWVLKKLNMVHKVFKEYEMMCMKNLARY